MKFETGHKVKWNVGRDERTIICRGAFLEKIDDTFSKVQIREHNGKTFIQELAVPTEILKFDYEKE